MFPLACTPSLWKPMDTHKPKNIKIHTGNGHVALEIDGEVGIVMSEKQARRVASKIHAVTDANQSKRKNEDEE